MPKTARPGRDESTTLAVRTCNVLFAIKGAIVVRGAGGWALRRGGTVGGRLACHFIGDGKLGLQLGNLPPQTRGWRGGFEKKKTAKGVRRSAVL